MGAPSPIETIQTVGSYTLLEKLGEGYLGSVFRGFSQSLGQAVAVRILCDGIKWDPRIEEILNCQCQAVAGLQHEGIASVFDFGKEEKFHYIVMESLGSSQLKSLIAQRPDLTVEAKLSIMIQVAEGLSHAHKHGILHRDLEPAKIHLAADGKAKIRDFGIAHVLMKHLPHPVIRWGVPIYLSPEQIQQKDCDTRSDVFSAGTIFYELVTYLHPFHDRDSNKALDNILMETQIPTFDLFPDVPPGIWPILKTCLAKDPNDRFQSMDELSSACRDLLKDLAEDSRLMLSELYAALPPLRKAAARPDAPQNTIALFQDIQKLLSGEKQVDYISLDQLMTNLIEQYPTVQSISGSLPDSVPEYSDHPSQETNAGRTEGAANSSSYQPVEIQAPSPIELALTTVLVSDGLAHSTEHPAGHPIPLSKGEEEDQDDIKGSSESPFEDLWDLASEMPLAFESSLIKPEEDRLSVPGLSQNEATPEQTSFSVPDSIEPETSKEPDDKPGLPDTAEHVNPKITEPADSLPNPSPIPEIPFAGHAGVKAPDCSSCSPVAATTPTNQDSSIDVPPPIARKGNLATCYRRIRRPSYRTTVALLSMLLIAAAAYIVWGTDAAEFFGRALKTRVLNSGMFANAMTRFHHQPRVTVSAATGTEELKSGTDSQPIIASAAEAQQGSLPEKDRSTANRPPQELIARISGLITSGKEPLAKAELDKLQQAYPTAPQLSDLRKQLANKSSAFTQEQARKEEEQRKAAWNQREEEWSSRLNALVARGQYSEANSALNLWLVENPGSPTAREFGAKIAEIQRLMNLYASAVAENRYAEALNALSSAEKLNPADLSFAEMRRQIEARKASAKASLTVHRLGAKGTLLLDGHPVGTDGELENEPIPIGTHTFAIENNGSLVASKRQEFLESQRIVLVYDTARQILRAMVDTDRELLAQRKIMEEVRYFDVEHEHGTFRGSCHGLFMIDYLDVAFRPSAGYHGFRIPLKLLRLNVRGKIVDLVNISDNQNLQSLKFHDEQSAEKLKRSWDELKAFTRQ